MFLKDRGEGRETIQVLTRGRAVMEREKIFFRRDGESGGGMEAGASREHQRQKSIRIESAHQSLSLSLFSEGAQVSGNGCETIPSHTRSLASVGIDES